MTGMGHVMGAKSLNRAGSPSLPRGGTTNMSRKRAQPCEGPGLLQEIAPA